MDALNLMWIVICAIIILDMQAGFLCLESGIARSKNAANVALKNLTDVCVVSMAFWAVGFGFMYGPSGNGFFAWGPFLPDVHALEEGRNALFLFQMAFAATAATIVSGAVAERERYAGYVCLSLLLGAFVYPVAGHWIWGGSLPGSSEGWLYQMGFIDFAGATVVHAVGGWAALCAILVLGPRRGRFGRKSRTFEENSIALAGLGTILLWIGWGAFNGGSALVFNASVPTIIINTMITAACGGLTCILTSAILLRHVRIDWALNGVLAGLVAGTAGVHMYGAHASILVGMLGGCAMLLCSFILERCRVDDVVGAVPVHLAAGSIGTLIVPFLAPIDILPAGDRFEQFQIQAIGFLAVGIWVCIWLLPAAYVLRRAGMLRATAKNEVRGLNLAENRQSNAFQDLLEDMRQHTVSANFSRKARVERSTAAGSLALGYNHVLDRVAHAMQNEREQRSEAEAAFVAMKQAQEESAWVARHDKLTGMGNRLLLEEMSEKTSLRKDGVGFLAVAIDLDRFKDVNDTFGHEAGDVVLVACAERLRSKIRSDVDHGFRIGGDEFVLRLEDSEVRPDDEALCAAILDELIKPVEYGGADLRIGASIGFARGAAGETFGAILKRADLALYEAKKGGRNRSIAYHDEIGQEHEAKIALIDDFKRAMENEEFDIHLQPQVRADDLSMSGIEVLVRWVHPERGVLSPDVFMPIAEELKMLGDLDKMVLDMALQARTALIEQLGYETDISVNVSARRLLDPNLIPELRGRQDLPTSGLSFEILETAFLDSITEDLADQIFAIKGLGIDIEVDDFGTGHASFASVLALSPDRLKIDRVFVPGVDEDENKLRMMRGIIDMARNVSAKTVVEGVETASEAEALRRVGADFLQGYAFAKPMALDDFILWARNYAAERRSA